MATNGDTTPNAHITEQFREAFGSWSQFRQFVSERAATPEFDTDRALHQILTADFAARLTAASPHDWLLFGSLALPVRPSPEDLWPSDLTPVQETRVHPAYVMARSAFDLDLSALDVTDPDPETAVREFGRQMSEAVHAVTATADGRDPERAIGLGGLVHYTADVTIHPTGKLMGVIIAQPIDPRYGPTARIPVDDPIALEIDIKPPNRVRLFGPPQPAHRSVVGLDIPGFAPVTPAVYPTASQLADKITMISGPPPQSARRTASGPWHRYKDVFDIHYMIRTSRVDAEQLREAVRVNNQERFGWEELPRPFRAYGQEVTAGEKPIPWHEASEALRAEQAQLAGYPQFTQMQETVSAFVAELEIARPGSTWVPGQGWTDQRSVPEQTRPTVALGVAAEAPNSLVVLSDDDLAQHQADLTDAAQALTTRAATAAETAQTLANRYQRDGGDAVARLTAAGAEPDIIERARTAATEDVAHAREAAEAARTHLNDVNGLIHQAGQEVERRVGLTPQQRQAEQAARQQLAAQRQAQTPQVPPPAPKIAGPEGPSRGGAAL
ncbi:nucleotidyl transferase AbiEii/AbiGii toxin family protein [Streptomyces sp. NBC_01615]|uniref:nucleotidyl transferase AbiEii/AbiGii toxin family protein n=1 Tax=Streptomyces sp. NBC_01615 TaxID=2975898 RepID=UPI00386678D0